MGQRFSRKLLADVVAIFCISGHITIVRDPVWGRNQAMTLLDPHDGQSHNVKVNADGRL